MIKEFLLDEKHLLSFRHLEADENGIVRLILGVPEHMTDARLEVGGRLYPAFTNLEEPYQKRFHGFDVPRDELLAHPLLTLHMRGDKDVTEILPEPYAPCALQALYRPEEAETVENLLAGMNRGVQMVSSKTEEVTEGLSYCHFTAKTKDDMPIELFVLEADPQRIGFTVGTVGDGLPITEDGKTMYRIATVEATAWEQIERGLPVVAATNADFFDMFGDNHPAGLVVRDGSVLANADSDRPFFGVLKDGSCVITSLAYHPEYREQLQTAVCGSHIVLRNGVPHELALLEPFAELGHPRTVVGLCTDGRVLVAVIDGRIPDYSNGATLLDVALIFASLGATDVINLDGGGSSIMLLRPDGEDGFSIQNRPADIDRPNDFLIREGYCSLLLYKK